MTTALRNFTLIALTTLVNFGIVACGGTSGASETVAQQPDCDPNGVPFDTVQTGTTGKSGGVNALGFVDIPGTDTNPADTDLQSTNDGSQSSGDISDHATKSSSDTTVSVGSSPSDSSSSSGSKAKDCDAGCQAATAMGSENTATETLAKVNVQRKAHENTRDEALKKAEDANQTAVSATPCTPTAVNTGFTRARPASQQNGTEVTRHGAESRAPSDFGSTVENNKKVTPVDTKQLADSIVKATQPADDPQQPTTEVKGQTTEGCEGLQSGSFGNKACEDTPRKGNQTQTLISR